MERAPVQLPKISKSLDIGDIGLKEQSKAKISFNIIHFDMIPPRKLWFAENIHLGGGELVKSGLRRGGRGWLLQVL